MPRFHSNIPTVDFYFRAALKDLIGPSLQLFSKKPIRRLGPYCFICKNHAVIIRYATSKELRKLRKLSPERVDYVVDDDFFALSDAASLPEEYRKKLEQFRRESLPHILQLADTVIVPNAALLTPFADKKHLVLPPCYTHLCRDFFHFEKPEKIQIIFSGTRSHLADLDFLADILLAVSQKRPNTEITTFLGDHAPAALLGRKNIVHRRPLKWPRYQRVLAKERFHIALAPRLDTAFNRGRSYSKIFEHAALGAAGLYSDRPPLQDVIDHKKNGLLLADYPDLWLKAIIALVDHPKTARDLAHGGARLTAQIGHPRHVRSFWCQRLKIAD